MQVSIVRRVAVAVFAASFVATAAPAVAAEPTAPANFDARADDVPVRVAPAVKQARAALETVLGEDADVRIAPSTGAVTYIGSPLDLLTGPATGDAADIVLDYVREHGDVFGLGKADIANLKLVARSESPDGITHVRFNQVLDGIESYDSGIEGHVTRDGSLINVSGGAVPNAKLPGTKAKLSAVASLGEARDAVDGSGLPSAVDATKGGAARETAFTSGETARLRWLATADGPQLVWHVLVDGDDGAGYSTLIDASGDDGVLVVASHTSDIGLAKYFDDNPLYTPVMRTSEMPSAWYDDSANGARLWGRYAKTYADPDNVDPTIGSTAGTQIPASAPAQKDWVYTQNAVAGTACPPAPSVGCTWNSTVPGSSLTNERQAAVNAHVRVSSFHDSLAAAPIGFDEASGNFQRTNTSGSGLAGDQVRVEVNDGSGTNNANMTTWPDGQAPRMQMYLWTYRAVNGSDVADVLYHEYAHGLSNRLVVNASGVGALTPLQSGMMGEGWSDFYAMDRIVEDGFRSDSVATRGELVMAEYALNPVANPNGIRTEAMDCPVDVSNVSSRCNGGGQIGGLTLGDMTTHGAVHSGGEIWSQTLWQLRQRIGRAPALALVTGGMRLSPDGPSMLQMRDAILQQAIAMRSAAGAVDDYYDDVWIVFAERGMGWSASASPSSSAVTQAFNLPPASMAFAGAARLSDPYPGGDADGVIEPGETVAIAPMLRVDGLGLLTGITGLLSPITGGAQVVRGSAAWEPSGRGAVSAAASAFLVRMPETCGTTSTFSIVATSSAGNASTTVDIAAGGGWTGSVAIPDNVPSGVSIPFVVRGSGAITDIDLRIQELRHSWLGDLTIKLQHPDGTVVTLFDRPGYPASAFGLSGDDLLNVVFDSQAVASFPTIGSGPFTGRYRPSAPSALDAFNGKSIAGTWKLVVSDSSSGDTGSVRALDVSSPQQECGRAEIPISTTGDAAPVTHDSATVAGTVDPNGRATGMRIAYGTTESYGSVTAQADAGAGIGAQPFGAVLGGLTPSTTYHYRIEAIREGGVMAVAGTDRTFMTAPAPVASSTSTSSSAPASNANTGKVGALGGADKVAPKFLGKVVPIILPMVKGKAKVSFGFKLSEAAQVKIVVAKVSTGVKVGKKCLAKKSGRSGKACVLLTPVGATTKALKSGGSTLAAGALKPGSYVATITASDAAKNASRPIALKFTVKAAAPKRRR